ncbi:VanZ family protein, partial [Burkholderia pseudomallei]
VLLSGSMESLQTYLPTRVASNLDLGANALGALLGAALAAPATGALLDRGALRRRRFAWLEADGATPLLPAASWPFASVFPSPLLFGIGDLPAALWERADASLQDALLAWLRAAWRVSEWTERG